jgi:hypothetical protein
MDPMFTGTPAQENVMTGSLVGCWYTDTLVINPAQPNGTPSGTIQATGTEHFVGCLDVDGDGTCAGDPSRTLPPSTEDHDSEAVWSAPARLLVRSPR